MDSRVSLFSRLRSTKPAPPKKVRGFLGLPAELRNEIYGYYFQEPFRCEVAANGSSFNEKEEHKSVRMSINALEERRTAYNKKMKNDESATVRISRPLGRYKRVHGVQTNWATSLCPLLLVCKQMYQETVVLLYLNTTFVFEAPKRITNFINVVPKKNLANITKLQLHYVTYGHPFQSIDCQWGDKHGDSWKRACREAAKELNGLRELYVKVFVNDTNLHFSFHETWLDPLLEFRRLSVIKSVAGADDVHAPKPLYDVKINLQSVYTTRRETGFTELLIASTDLHRLFAKAIALVILGREEASAMAPYIKAWNGKYRFWQPILRFSDTTW